MAISDKILYLNDTKKLLKQEINKSTEITDEDTFRSYAPKIYDGYLDILNNGTDTLWNNLEKVSQTGAEAVLEGVETAPIKMVLNGNTSQDTTTGKNLFNKDNEQKIVINPTTGTERYGIIIEAPNKKVSFSGTWLSDNNLAYKLINGETYGSYVSFNSPITIDVQDKILFYNGTENQKLSAIVDKIQIEIGTITSYEPYTGGQPSPSPDYPQEVKVVKGENVVSVSGKNLVDLTKHTNTLASNTTILNSNSYQCDLNGSWKGEIVVPIENLKPNTDYVISANVNSSATNSIISYIRGYNGSDYTELVKDIYFGWFKNGLKFNSGEYESYVLKLFITGYSSRTGIEKLEDIQIEESTAKTDFVPYSKTDYPINLGTLELCKIGNYQDYFHKYSGKWYVHKEIGKKIFDGSESWNERTNAINVKQFYVSNTLPPIINTTQYCNYFAKYNGSNIYNYGAIGDFAILTNTKQFFGCVNSDLTLENFKTLLSSNNLIVYYVLTTPTEEEITNTTLISQLEAIYKAKSVKDKTYITQTNDELPFILDVEAIKEYEENLDNN